MNSKRLYWVLGGVALIAAAAVLAINYWPKTGGPLDSKPAATLPGMVASINGEPISEEALDREYQALLQIYRQQYAQNGSNLDDVLVDSPQGAYNKLKIRYQAFGRLLDRVLIQQELKDRKIEISTAELENAVQEKFDRYVIENGLISEANFNSVMQDPKRRQLAQQVLGFSENSVDAFKARMRRELEAEMRYRKLADAVTGGKSDPSSQAYLDQINEWLKKAQRVAKIDFQDAVLGAYEKETRVSGGQTLEERRALLAEAVAAYEKVKTEKLSDDPYLDFYLGRLYNMSVNWDLQLERDLTAKADESNAAKQKAEEIGKAIQLNRSQASQALQAYETENEEQINLLLQADPGNPYYYFLLAEFYFGNPDKYSPSRPIRLLDTALKLEPKYIDALVLLGDVNSYREFYSEAIKNYQSAVQYYPDIKAEPGLSYLMIKNPDVEGIERKLASAYIARAGQLDTMKAPPADAAEERAGAIQKAEKILTGLTAKVDKSRTEEHARIAAVFGDLEILRKNYVKAQEHYSKSLALVVDKEVYIKLGDAYLFNQQLKEAEANYNKALEMDAYLAKAHLGLAKVYRSLGDAERAKKEYALAFEYGINLAYLERRAIALEALDLDPNNLEMRLTLADYYYEGHVYSGAVKQYEEVQRREPGSVPAVIGIGKVALDRLQYPDALAQFDAALKLAPSPSEEIQIYELIVKAEKGMAGPGKAVSDAGQEAIYKLAVLYLQNNQLSRSFDMLEELSGRYPEFKKDQTAYLRSQLTRTVGDSLPGLPVADQGHEIIAPGDAHPEYNSTPPTSGWHYALPASWGIHSTGIENEIQLRNLASGGVLIQYKPDLEQQTLERLLELVKTQRREPEYCQIIIAPNAGLDSPIALTAWNRIDRLDEFNRGRIVGFIDAFIGRGPEAGEVGCSAAAK